MKFIVGKGENPNLGKYRKEDLELARTFAKKVYDEFGNFLKAVVLFGSSARATSKIKKGSDIDILLIVDDITTTLTPEVVETYRIIVEKAIADVSKRLHITSMKLTTFWEYARVGDPVAVNILRDGVALMDSGFFDPMRVLLMRGRIRPTAESIWTYYTRAPATMHNSKWHIMKAALDLYWAVIDAAHAALMKLGEVPPSPEHVADIIQEKMVKKGLIAQRYAKMMRNFYNMGKMITHGEIQEMSGAEYDTYREEAEDFIGAMKEFIEK